MFRAHYVSPLRPSRKGQDLEERWDEKHGKYKHADLKSNSTFVASGYQLLHQVWLLKAIVSIFQFLTFLTKLLIIDDNDHKLSFKEMIDFKKEKYAISNT